MNMQNFHFGPVGNKFIPEMKSIRIHIKGNVYKTGFRFYALQVADMCRVKGTVRYLDDKSVLIEAVGTLSAIEEFLNYCRIGNISSRIDDVEVSETTSKSFDSFEVLNGISRSD